MADIPIAYDVDDYKAITTLAVFVKSQFHIGSRNDGGSCNDGSSCQTEMQWVDGSNIEPNMFTHGLSGGGSQCVFANDDMSFNSASCNTQRKVVCQFQCLGTVFIPEIIPMINQTFICAKE